MRTYGRFPVGRRHQERQLTWPLTRAGDGRDRTDNPAVPNLGPRGTEVVPHKSKGCGPQVPYFWGTSTGLLGGFSDASITRCIHDTYRGLHSEPERHWRLPFCQQSSIGTAISWDGAERDVFPVIHAFRGGGVAIGADGCGNVS